MGEVRWLTPRVQGGITFFILRVKSKSALLSGVQGLSRSLFHRKGNLNAVSIDFILPFSR